MSSGEEGIDNNHLGRVPKAKIFLKNKNAEAAPKCGRIRRSIISEAAKEEIQS